MRYKIEFDLPDNDTVLECIGSAYASWGVWGYSGYTRVVPVDADRKTGKWEIYVISPFDGEGCRCSECKYEGAPYWDFCPNCGAKMEKGEDV